MSHAIHQQVTDRILNALAEGLVPWQRPWLGHKNDGPPSNVLSSSSFRGINRLLLNLAGFKSKWWATQRTWTTFGVQVKPHQQGALVYHGKLNDLGSRTVFNAEQADGPGVERYLVSDQVEGRLPAFDAAERVIAATGADIRHLPQDGAFYYRLPLDYIELPLKTQFEEGPYGVAPYYRTVFHELGHFSEHRLGWLADPHLSIRERYWIGEMRAVLGAAFLLEEVGIPDLIKEKERFLPRWIQLCTFRQNLSPWRSLNEEV